MGRCSDYVLGDRPECLKVFVHGEMEDRVLRCVEEYHIPSANMAEQIREMDRGRSNYYNYYTGHIWGEMRRYDLTINSSVTGIEGAVGPHRDPGAPAHRSGQRVTGQKAPRCCSPARRAA